MGKSTPDAALREAMFESLKETALRLIQAGQVSRAFPFGLSLFRLEALQLSNHCFEEPLAGVTLQGRKIIRVGQTDTELLAGSLLVTCIDAPSVSTVTEASDARPYLSVYIKLNRQIMADLLFNSSPTISASSRREKFWTAQADLEILDAFRRLLTILEQDPESQLVEMIARELHYMVLNAPQSGLLRLLYAAGCGDSRISAVIIWMRENLSYPVSMEDLAKMAHMSVSTFHRHFKSITGISPLQYHKQLRLYEAQRLMLAINQPAAEAAFAVGYESVTQFNREYRRLFGEPPGRDIAQRRKRFKFLETAVQQAS